MLHGKKIAPLLANFFWPSILQFSCLKFSSKIAQILAKIAQICFLSEQVLWFEFWCQISPKLAKWRATAILKKWSPKGSKYRPNGALAPNLASLMQFFISLTIFSHLFYLVKNKRSSCKGGRLGCDGSVGKVPGLHSWHFGVMGSSPGGDWEIAAQKCSVFHKRESSCSKWRAACYGLDKAVRKAAGQNSLKNCLTLVWSDVLKQMKSMEYRGR